MTERTIMGTARYVGFGGAMSAIGGDPSAVRDNPAGLGLYRRTELMVTLDYALDQTHQQGTNTKYQRHLVMAPEASLVISMPVYQSDERGVLSHNFMLSYHRLHSYARTIYGSAEQVNSLGAVIASASQGLKIGYCADRKAESNSFWLSESGYANEYALDWSLNVSNKFYTGLGLRMQSYRLSSEGDFLETFEKTNADGTKYSNRDQTSLILSGVSCNLSVGFIYRPASWIRLGFGLQTPSLGVLNTGTSGTFTAQTDTVARAASVCPTEPSSQFHQPLHTSASVAFQIGYYGLIAFQYDYYHQSDKLDIHSLRAGLEVIPVPGMYINAGYVYENTFKKPDSYPIVPIAEKFDRYDAYFLQPRWTQYASVAIGYRGKSAIVQAAYQYRWQALNVYAHQNAEPYDIRTDTHRVVLTIGWHRY